MGNKESESDRLNCQTRRCRGRRLVADLAEMQNKDKTAKVDPSGPSTSDRPKEATISSIASDTLEASSREETEEIEEETVRRRRRTSAAEP